jgi:membrane associated rhomboid family serine protease
MGLPLNPTPAYGIIPSISERLVPRFNVKTFTFFISVLDVLMFIVTLIYAGVSPGNDGVVFDASNEMVGPSGKVLVQMGAKVTPCIQDGEVWRLVTPIFLHGGLLHLASNLFFTLHLCFTFEKRWTTARFIAIYFITGIGASLLSAVATPGASSVGASGALFGVFGANVIYLFMNWNDIPNNKAEACFMTFVIIINFFMGLSSALTDTGIDIFAHVGGLVAGIFVGAFLCPPINIWPKTKLYQM